MQSNDFSLRVQAENVTAKLPFDENQQLALMGHIMLQENFFRQVYRKLQPEWFLDENLTRLYTAYCEFFERFSRVPLTPEEFQESDIIMSIDQKVKVALKAKIVLCRAKTAIHGLDSLSSQLTVWQKTQLFLRNLPQVANLINSRQIERAEDLFHSTAKELTFSSFKHEAVAQWDNYRMIRDAEEFDSKGALSTGLTILDRKLLPGVPGGSLLPGDTTVILAPTNTGKTAVMLTIARHNIFARKAVLFITREGREFDIMTKMYQSVFKKTRPELWTWSRTPEGEQTMDEVTKYMGKYMTYIHEPRVNAYVEDIIGDIMRLQAARQAQHGKGYDMLVVDYPGIFQARETKGARWEYRQVQDYLYRQFVQLGAQERFHVVLAAQTNREGSKVNSGLTTKRLLSFEDVAEAFGIAQSATNIITLNRDDKAKSKGYITFYLVKSRSSETGWAITARSDYSRAMTHSDELGATAYRGNLNVADQIEQLLKNYTNVDIPDGMIDGYKVQQEEETK